MSNTDSQRLDAMRRQRDGYRNQLRKAEQQVARVRELIAMHKGTRFNYIFIENLEAILGGGTLRCVECGGTGDVQVRFAHGVQAQDCASCFGTGEIRALGGEPNE